jgi:signal transduction histidine kinase
LAGPEGVLSELSRLCSADGCVLWLWTEQCGPEDRQLFAAAAWFDREPSNFFRYLSNSSPTTRQAIAEKPANFATSPYLNFDEHDPDAKAAQDLGIQSYCVIPVWWPDDAANACAAGVVNFYRCREEALSEAEFKTACHLAGLVLQMLTDAANRSAMTLLRSIAKELGRPGTLSNDPAKPFSAGYRSVLEKPIHLIMKVLDCAEASIYLQRPRYTGEGLELVSSEWPWSAPQKQFYKAGKGLTGYCFLTGVPVRIFDLRRFKQDFSFIEREYPGIHWDQSFDMNEPVKGQVIHDGRPAPLSFVAAPIMDEGNVLGVLRCCGVKSAPYYFSSVQSELLQFIAKQLGDWCGYSFRLHSSNERLRWLGSYVEAMSRLNRQAHESAMERKPDRSALYEQALRTAAQAVPAAHSYCLRLADKDRTRLAMASHLPDLDQNWRFQARKIRSTELALRGPDESLSAAADAFNNNEVVAIRSFLGSKYRQLFFENENTEGLIVAPISSAQQKYGTIEVRFRDTLDISEQTVTVMELLGHQLGLYFFLGEQIQKLRDSETRLETAIRVQQETFENLQHQLKTPVTLAHKKAKRISRDITAGSPLASELITIKGLLRRAEQVASNVKLFGQLARDLPVQTRLTAATQKVLLPRLNEAVKDFNALASRKVRFVVDERSFEVLNFTVVYLDLELLDQMIDNLLDNASKYGTEPSTATISVGLTRKGKYFFVSVTNKGLPVTASRARILMQRGERSDQAVWSGHEGSGLGLYIVGKILQGHKGILEIIPTDERGVTDFRLLFPVGAEEGINALRVGG